MLPVSDDYQATRSRYDRSHFQGQNIGWRGGAFSYSTDPFSSGKRHTAFRKSEQGISCVLFLDAAKPALQQVPSSITNALGDRKPIWPALCSQVMDQRVIESIKKDFIHLGILGRNHYLSGNSRKSFCKSLFVTWIHGL
jgi:hypothetical protein